MGVWAVTCWLEVVLVWSVWGVVECCSGCKVKIGVEVGVVTEREY